MREERKWHKKKERQGGREGGREGIIKGIQFFVDGALGTYKIT